MAQQLATFDQRPTHEEIARRAYALFVQSGRVPGRELDNWLDAEAQLTAVPRHDASPLVSPAGLFKTKAAPTLPKLT